MSSSHASTSPSPRAPLLSLARLKAPWIASLIFSVLMLPGWEAPYAVLIGRLLIISTLMTLVFGALERWPRRQPRRIPRWALRVIGVALTAPFAAALAYQVTTFDAVPWWQESARLSGCGQMMIAALLVGPWMAMVALLHEVRGEARQQALAFDLERSRLQRREADARLQLMQAQVQPHFLFNTLANVRELVSTGSSQADAVLGHLIAYLRAAVPRLDQTDTTLDQELELVRAYLEVMHMRMPDRLDYTVHADDDALSLSCPPMTLLTLVENAISHGIDPSEDGGRVQVLVRRRGTRCHVEVLDTGMGLRQGSSSLGTGLETLRERLSLAFDGDVSLNLAPHQPRGASAVIDFPAREPAP